MERGGPKNGQNIIWCKNTEKTGCPKNAKMSEGVTPHLFKPTKRVSEFCLVDVYRSGVWLLIESYT